MKTSSRVRQNGSAKAVAQQARKLTPVNPRDKMTDLLAALPLSEDDRKALDILSSAWGESAGEYIANGLRLQFQADGDMLVTQSRSAVEGDREWALKQIPQVQPVLERIAKVNELFSLPSFDVAGRIPDQPAEPVKRPTASQVECALNELAAMTRLMECQIQHPPEGATWSEDVICGIIQINARVIQNLRSIVERLQGERRAA